MQNKKTTAILLAVLAAAFYAVNVPFSKLLLNQIGPTFLASLLYFGAGIGIGILYLSNPKKHAGEKKLTRKDLPYTIGMILLDIAAPILLMLGLKSATSANASLLGNFEIVATSLIALFLFREKISRRLWIAIALITLSSGILSFEDMSSLHFSGGSLLVLAAAAYAQGLDWFTYDCTGSIQTAGETFRCALGRAHGTVNLRGALEQSCNCYFIALGQLLGGQAILNAAQSFGLGNPALLAPGLKSAAGELPSAADLQNAGSLASLSFGQGGLTVTPLQVTAMFNAIASGGVYHSPCIVSSITGGTQVPQQPQPAAACSPAVARVLQSMLTTVVRSGIGGDAQPHTGTAAGKTGTAQTGQFDADGRELLHYWFAGFYPADAPRYTITVLQDSQQKPQTSSAALFAQVADALAVLDAAITEKPAENS